MDDHELGEIIGRGGMGVVHRARQKSLDRDVALKILELPGDSSGTSDIARFRREIALLSGLSHPNVVRIFDSGSIDGRLCFTMELVRGNDLATHLATVGRLEIRETLSILGQLLDALDYIHSRNFLHRDIKPRNVMLESTGRVVLMDFGLAQCPEWTTITSCGNLIGTAYYVAPETVRGNAHSVRSDLWSLGVLAYELITGRKPFIATSMEGLLFAIVNDPPVAIEALRPGTPLLLTTIVSTLMSKDPEDRPALASEVKRSLGSLLEAGHECGRNGPCVESGRPPQQERRGRETPAGRVPRHRRVTGWTLVAALALVGLASFALVFPRTRVPHPSPGPVRIDATADRIRRQIGLLVDDCCRPPSPAGVPGRVRQVHDGVDRVTREAILLPVAARRKLWLWQDDRPGLCELFYAASCLFGRYEAMAVLGGPALAAPLARLEDRTDPLWWAARRSWLCNGLAVDGSAKHRKPLDRVHGALSGLLAAVLALADRSEDSVPVIAEVAGLVPDLTIDDIDQDAFDLVNLHLFLEAFECVTTSPSRVAPAVLARLQLRTLTLLVSKVTTWPALSMKQLSDRLQAVRQAVSRLDRTGAGVPIAEELQRTGDFVRLLENASGLRTALELEPRRRTRSSGAGAPDELSQALLGLTFALARSPGRSRTSGTRAGTLEDERAAVVIRQILESFRPGVSRTAILQCVRPADADEAVLARFALARVVDAVPAATLARAGMTVGPDSPGLEIRIRLFEAVAARALALAESAAVHGSSAAVRAAFDQAALLETGVAAAARAMPVNDLSRARALERIAATGALVARHRVIHGPDATSR